MAIVNSLCFDFYQLFLQNFEEKTELILFLATHMLTTIRTGNKGNF